MTVYLVGAGPGDPGLLTCRGAELLGLAEVVVHDRLVDAAVLALARRAARLVDVGKTPGEEDPAASQQRINELLVAEARRHHTVVRLKGGDPYLFGRGAEEALALEAAGVAYEVVPGVPSAFAVPAAAGVPVTHRGVASVVSVLSGHAGSAQPLIGELADASGTLVVLMAAATCCRFARRLLDAGRDPETPVLLVERGTTPEQRSWRGSLATLAGSAGKGPGGRRTEPPALLVVGSVAGLSLAGYEQRPLAGWRVVVTRAPHQAPPLLAALAAAGARAVELPAIAIEPPRDGGIALATAVGRLASYAWVVFSSANAVEQVLPLLRDARAFGAARVAAIGSATAAALASHGVVADLVPDRFVAEALLEAFPPPGRPPPVGPMPPGPVPPGPMPPGPMPPGPVPRVLLPLALQARDVLPEGLRRLGYDVDVVEAYRSVAARPAPEALAALAGADAVTFTSSSSVRSFLELAGRERVPPVVASIGPLTSRTAREHGLEVAVEAATSTVDGLVEALCAYAAASPRR